MSRITCQIDGRRIEVDAGTTILDAAKQLQIDIPVLCFSPQCQTDAGCMVCAVQEHKSQQMLPACSTLCQSDMDIDTCSEKVRQFHRTTLALLLSEHRGSCEAPCYMVCPQRLDIPAFLKQVSRSDAQINFPFDRAICEACGGKCERACRRSQLDAAIKIRELLFAAGRHRRQESEPVKETAYNHTMGKLSQKEIDHLLAQDGPALDLPDHPLEAGRCLQCACSAKNRCQLRDLASLYQARQHAHQAEQFTTYQIIPAGKMVFQPSKCVKCGRCVRLGERLKPGCGPVMAYRSQQSIISPPFGMGYAQAFSGHEAEFARECPTGALELL